MTQNPTTRNVFLVDDDQEDRELFAEALAEVDPTARLTEITSCFQLMDALNNPATPTPDIIFLDFELPKFNGLECLKKIKESSKLNELKIVMLSTFSHPEYIDEAYKNGADFYYIKPTGFDKLKSVISHSLNVNWRLNDLRTKRNFIFDYSATAFVMFFQAYIGINILG